MMHPELLWLQQEKRAMGRSRSKKPSEEAAGGTQGRDGAGLDQVAVEVVSYGGILGLF